uniref:EF-hand domain-containing protein n=1 Tax=Strigamia maritima TaxID=126957 RepID=T1IIF3_STRMM
MDSQVEQNQYVAQLEEVFNSCDLSGSGHLDKSGLVRLCQRLQLEDQASFLINGLLRNDSSGTVNFDEFKDCFVALLTQSSFIDESEPVDFNLPMTSPESDMSPKYTWGNKKYGRRSRPESDDLEDLENEALSDYSDLEVFCNDSMDQSCGDRSKNIPLSVIKCDVESSFSNEISPLPSPITDTQPLFKKRRRRSIDDKTIQTFSINDIECKFTEAKCNDVNRSRIDNDNETENEYLQAIWKTLSVGKNGFLDLEELEKVCQHIGMENISQEVVSQLFDKLDIDQDGKISFQEFRHLFENGDANTATSSRSSSKSSTPQRVPHSWSGSLKPEEDCCEVAAESESGMFSSIDPDNSGHVNQETIIEFWESLGYQNGTQILKVPNFNFADIMSYRREDFGLYSSVISLLDLSNIMENLITSSDDNYHRQLALATVQQELKYSRNSLDQLKEERNKLKTDVTEANFRASMLAQEVDDQNSKLEKASQNKIRLIEKKYKEQLQALLEELSTEKDQVASQVLKAQSALQDEIAILRKESTYSKDQVYTLQAENDRFESEVRELTEKLKESERVNHSRMMELEAVAALRLKARTRFYFFATNFLDELESGKIQEQHFEKLLMELESLKLENQSLKDENDELALQIESLRQQILSRPSAKAACHKRNGSSLGEYVRNSAIKRRGHENTSSEDVEDSPSPRLGKIHCRTQEPDYTGSDLGHNYLKMEVNSEDEDLDGCDSNWQKQCLNDELAMHNNNIMSPVAAMCEVKQVFVYLRKRITEEILNDESKSEVYLNHQQKQRLEELEWERDNLEQQLDNLELKHGQDLRCLQLRLDDAVLTRTNNELVDVSSQTEISIMSDRCQQLKANLEVALNELEMSLVREVQGEELLSAFEQSYLTLRNKLSDDLQSRCEMRLAAGDSSPMIFSNGNTKVLHISSDLLQLIIDKLVHPIANVNSTGALAKSLLVLLLEFLIYTKDVVGKMGNLCGSGLMSCTNYSFLVEPVCSNLEKWLKDDDKLYFGNFDEQLEEVERKCGELEQIVNERNQILQVAQEDCLKWKFEVEKYSQKLKVHEEKSAARIANLEHQLNAILESDSDESEVKEVDETETQTEDDKFDETIEQLKGEELQLTEKCNELQSLKSHLEKEINDLRTDLKSRGVSTEQECNSSDHNHTAVELFAESLTESLPASSSSEGSCIVEINVLHNLNQRLNHLEKRCKFLEDAARTQAVEALKLQKMNNQQHHKEINHFKELLANTQSMLKQQAVDYENQLKTSDKIVKDLYVENAQLMKALQITEERQKQAEKLNVHLHDKCEALMHLVANIYKTATD